ncbi:uncharacterized protein FPRO_14849 [Fusarium proliferatum ET1]|uniref:Uncharacterized protein n=1 Tax=Fusarium proliferatum (strain ET1) TaxID=1227346 RepID=A0A1L7WAR5_FUSPR|nr:uncharacterized protein FPRO_15244 [Fusarium proliferatum ET1]XP_031090171.1 uncharacterized protein FPRO_14849 [Fusarium proliferatum ET1]CZR45580.1 uncharacterized protein FPRO_15244 [Fusarium proliferatum ET1]CZR49672.1 uncharacterized protein FPRO_14849 [Fusarium proliferatum ET1]
MSGRSARVRYQDTVTPSSPLQCGLPQGSPVSPILFLLYTEPIYRLGNPRGRFGYADDTAILSIADTLDETTAMASSSSPRWCEGAQRTAFPLTRRRPKSCTSPVASSDCPQYATAMQRSTPNQLCAGLASGWIQAIVQVHVEKWAAKAKTVAYHLRGLTNTIHGPLPSAVRSATKSVFRTRLRRTDELLAPCERPKLVQRCFHQEQMPPLQMASKEKSTGAFLHWVERLGPAPPWVVYSDGSLSSEGAASYGFPIHQNNVPIFDGSGRLGPAEVFDAEATGALEGLKAP